MSQLSLFTPQFDDRIRRIEVDGITHFSILDVFQYYGSKGSADNPTKYWKRSKARIEKQGGDLPGVVDRPVENGGRPTPFATFKTFLRIAQVVEIVEWEYIRTWMAEVAHERLEEIANPELAVDRFAKRLKKQGKDAAWIAQRLEGVVKRNEFTAALQAAMTDASSAYGKATNTMYVGLYERTAEELRKGLGLQKGVTLRDHFPSLALAYNGIAESLIASELGTAHDLEWAQAERIIATAAALIRPQIEAVSRFKGVDIVTGKPLLGGGS